MPGPLLPLIPLGLGLASAAVGQAGRNKAERERAENRREAAGRLRSAAGRSAYKPDSANYYGALVPGSGQQGQQGQQPGSAAGWSAPRLDAAKEAWAQAGQQEQTPGWMQQFDERAQGVLERPVTGPYEEQQAGLAQQLAQQAGQALVNPYEQQQTGVAQQLLQRADDVLAGPSVAEMQQRAGYEQAQRGIASQLAGARGVNPALLAKMGASQSSDLAAQNNREAAMLRAQEDQRQQVLASQMQGQAAGLYGNLQGQRSQGLADFGRLQGQAGGLYEAMTGQQQGQQQMQNQMAQYLMSQGAGRAQAQQQAQIEYERARQRAKEEQYGRQMDALQIELGGDEIDYARRSENAQMLAGLGGQIAGTAFGAMGGFGSMFGGGNGS